jgi:hypothetical protein
VLGKDFTHLGVEGVFHFRAVDTHHGHAIVMDVEGHHGWISAGHIHSCCTVLVSWTAICFAVRNNIPYLSISISTDPAGVNEKTRATLKTAANSLFQRDLSLEKITDQKVD